MTTTVTAQEYAALVKAQGTRSNTVRDPRAGGRAHKALMGQLTNALKMRGYAVYFVWDSRHSPAGKWDITALRPPRWLEVEAKTGKAVLSSEQKAYGTLMAQYPHVEARVVRDSQDDWQAFIDWIV